MNQFMFTCTLSDMIALIFSTFLFTLFLPVMLRVTLSSSQCSGFGPGMVESSTTSSILTLTLSWIAF